MAHGEIFDLEISNDGDIEFDTSNDVATITGEENIMQSVGIHTRNVTIDEVSNQFSKTQIERLRGEIESTLREDPQVSTDWLEIQLADYDRTEVVFDVYLTPNESYELPVPIEDETI